MENDINKKTSPNQMRILMKRVREGKFTTNESNISKKDLTMRDMLKITRTINEEVNGKETVYDQSIEEEKFKSIFERDKMGVSIKFGDLEVGNNYVFWTGIINGIIQFVYTVTPYDDSTGAVFNYLEGFSGDNPENEEIVKRVNDYFNTFKEYFRSEIINSNEERE